MANIMQVTPHYFGYRKIKHTWDEDKRKGLERICRKGGYKSFSTDEELWLRRQGRGRN